MTLLIMLWRAKLYSSEGHLRPAGHFLGITVLRRSFKISYATLDSFYIFVKWGSEKSRLFCAAAVRYADRHLSAFSADTARQLDVLGHDGDALCVDGAQVRVLEQADEVGLASLLQGHDGRTLKAQVGLEVLSDLADETLEGQLADQQLGALLVTTDLAERDCTGPVTMGLLDAAGRRSALASRLRGELLAWSLSTGRLACGLLRTCHSLFISSLQRSARVNLLTSESVNARKLTHSQLYGPQRALSKRSVRQLLVHFDRFFPLEYRRLI